MDIHPAKLEKLLDLINELVQADGSYIEKREALLKQSTDDDRISLAEFVCWFQTEDE